MKKNEKTEFIREMEEKALLLQLIGELTVITSTKLKKLANQKEIDLTDLKVLLIEIKKKTFCFTGCEIQKSGKIQKNTSFEYALFDLHDYIEICIEHAEEEKFLRNSKKVNFRELVQQKYTNFLNFFGLPLIQFYIPGC